MLYQIILIGNPGSGKSTIGSTIAKTPQFFESGVSWASGKTKKFVSKTLSNGNYIIDTPGLEDVDLREKASQEIKKALSETVIPDSKSPMYKIIFVVVLEAGRIRSEDVVTINIVMKALDEHAKYNIVINKIPEKTLTQLLDSDTSKSEFLAPLNKGLKCTPSSISFIPFDRAAIEESNILLVSRVTLCNNELTVIEKDISLDDLPLKDAIESCKVTYVNDLEIKDYNKDVEFMENMAMSLKTQNAQLKESIYNLRAKTPNHHNWIERRNPYTGDISYFNVKKNLEVYEKPKNYKGPHYAVDDRVCVRDKGKQWRVGCVTKPGQNPHVKPDSWDEGCLWDEVKPISAEVFIGIL